MHHGKRNPHPPAEFLHKPLIPVRLRAADPVVHMKRKDMDPKFCCQFTQKQ